ncbi:hypothetical protein FNV43_RR25414 [Rhamnella rubrinervis]|uniref:Uncharacterized protein n=1 Tax=Rhamnella rubrinervis TaxID=2594499 RepID=A0A8K0DT39_9ROSA|nr:hypothetical protein FNV43_RR25414 [Rhamnella rubrinervis]
MMGVSIAVPPCVDVIPRIKLVTPDLVGQQTHFIVGLSISLKYDVLFKFSRSGYLVPDPDNAIANLGWKMPFINMWRSFYVGDDARITVMLILNLHRPLI